MCVYVFIDKTELKKLVCVCVCVCVCAFVCVYWEKLKKEDKQKCVPVYV